MESLRFTSRRNPRARVASAGRVGADAALVVVLERLETKLDSVSAKVDEHDRKLDVLECFVYQHGLRHMGEIEHGRALVGLKGMTS